jgi:hypothetical protein
VGLFKVVALYAADRFHDRQRRTLRRYFEPSESPRFEAGLHLAIVLFDFGVTAPLVSLLGVPSVGRRHRTGWHSIRVSSSDNLLI